MLNEKPVGQESMELHPFVAKVESRVAVRSLPQEGQRRRCCQRFIGYGNGFVHYFGDWRRKRPSVIKGSRGEV